MNELVYVYGFVADAAAAPPRALGGIDGAPVEVLSAGDIFAVVSRLPGSDYSPAAIDAGIEDLNWVGARGLEHERVVAWFVDHAEILPVPLLTLFSSVGALQADVHAKGEMLKSAMQRLRGQREWDLKVTWDHTVLASHAAEVMDVVREIDAEISTAPAGRGFLLQKKRAELVKNELSAAARLRARTLLEQLAAYATDVVALPLPRAMELPVVMNAALLVRRDDETALNEAAAREAAALHLIGIHAQLTGPWAPYRFTDDRGGSGSPGDMETRDVSAG